MYKKILINISLIVLAAMSVLAQNENQLSLDSCFNMAEANYPQVKQRKLLEISTAYSLDNARKGKLPQVSIIGQASYQSEVTSLPNGEALGAPQISKDQYKLYGEIVQPLTGISIINQQERIIQAQGEIQKANLEAQLYQIKERVSGLYFGILLVEKQMQQVELTKESIQTGLDKAEAAVKYGTSLKSNVSILKAELLKIDQRTIELKALQQGYIDMLGQFIGQSLTIDTEFVTPQFTLETKEINRPELNLFQAQLNTVALQGELLDRSNRPSLNLFLQTGVGRPALNFLSNDIEPYYIGGIRLNWQLSNLYTSKREKQLFEIDRQNVESERETFLFNTSLNLTNQEIQIEKMSELLDKDEEIIALRNEIVETSQGQLENGVITANDYRTVVLDADQARLNLVLHQVELLKLQNDYKLTAGN